MKGEPLCHLYFNGMENLNYEKFEPFGYLVRVVESENFDEFEGNEQFKNLLIDEDFI